MSFFPLYFAGRMRNFQYVLPQEAQSPIINSGCAVCANTVSRPRKSANTASVPYAIILWDK